MARLSTSPRTAALHPEAGREARLADTDAQELPTLGDLEDRWGVEAELVISCWPGLRQPTPKARP